MMEYEVTMICKVRKVVTVQCDTKEQAMNYPFEFSTHELETDQLDWEVVNLQCTEQDA